MKNQNVYFCLSRKDPDFDSGLRFPDTNLDSVNSCTIKEHFLILISDFHISILISLLVHS
jgi:hypothetical protein